MVFVSRKMQKETLLPVTTSLTATNKKAWHFTDRVTWKQQYHTATVLQGSSALALQRAEFFLVLSVYNLQFCFNNFSFNALSTLSSTLPHTHKHMRARANLTEFKTKTLQRKGIKSANLHTKALPWNFQETRVLQIFNNKKGFWISLQLFEISTYPKFDDKVECADYFIFTETSRALKNSPEYQRVSTVRCSTNSKWTMNLSHFQSSYSVFRISLKSKNSW
jgi:hypothetical protein